MKEKWSAQRMPRQDGKLAIITGASSGLGFHTALELARSGAEVIMPVRDANRGGTARSKILHEVPNGKISIETMDLTSLASVRAFADKMLSVGRALDILVNNAGIMSLPTRELTADGHEKQFGTNHLGHFALTGQLMPLLMRASSARVVTVSSGLASRGNIDFNNLQGEKRYSPLAAYSASKLANLLFMLELSRRAPSPIVSVGAHPGIASTNLSTSWLFNRVAQPASVGVLSQLYAASESDVSSGEYFGPGGWFNLMGPPQRVEPPKQATDEATARQLWVRSEELTGTAFAATHRDASAQHVAARWVAVCGGSAAFAAVDETVGQEIAPLVDRQESRGEVRCRRLESMPVIACRRAAP